jgi:cation-transporting ATPase 13A3/4/5
VLFFVSNFQYLCAAISFSVAYPFRKQIWTNVPYLLVIIAILAMDLAVLWLPYTNPISEFFIFAPFELISHDGELSVDYFHYRYWILLGVVLNCIITLCFERLLVSYLEKA